MKVSASLPTGVAALFFDTARRHRRLENLLVERLETRGFDEVILPVIDYLDPYEDMPTGMHREELYRFVDRDGAVLSLRSDFTPMVARLIAPRLEGYDLPLKLFYRGDVLRYQEERAGGERELFQLGGEVLGAPGEEGDRLALEQFLELVEIGERRRLLVVLGFAGALDELLLKHGDDCPGALVQAVARRERRHARATSPALLQVMENGVPDDAEALGELAAERLRSLQELALELGERFPRVRFSIDLAEFADQVVTGTLRRKLNRRPYYDGLVFRAVAGRAAEPIGGGGRYDRLFQRLGVDVAAAGFTVSLDRLLAPTSDGSES